jgi:poly[(R)-3-hydroxyalkanoate] polymerase subunit PhaC
MSARRGDLDGRALAEAFAWLRPGDLVCKLLGEQLPARQESASVRHLVLERRHHPDERQAACRFRGPGHGQRARRHARKADGARHPDRPVPVGADSYIVAGIADHITPWQNCYRSTQLLGGESRFILSTGGHIAALVNPPGSPKATYQTSKTNPASPADWLKTAQSEQGSWWPDMLAWLGDRCGADKPAPNGPGGGGLPPLAAAPGTYVFDN